MNIILWILQVLLAFYHIAGGVYMMGHYSILANRSVLQAFPAPFWIALGVLEVLFAIGVVLPGIIKRYQNLTSVSAAGLAVLSLWGIMLYVAYSGFPGMLWALLPALLSAFVAYKRRVKS